MHSPVRPFFIPIPFDLMKRTLFVFLLLPLLISTASAQRDRRFKPNSITVEFFGKSFLWGAITNERYVFEDKIGIGTGLGFANFERSDISRSTTGGVSEEGSFTGLAFSIPVYGFASLGKRRSKHRLYIPFGLTFLCNFEYSNYPSGTFGQFDIQPTPVFGGGYEFRDKKWFLRVTANLLVLGEDSGVLPPVLPWPGLILGWRY